MCNSLCGWLQDVKLHSKHYCTNRCFIMQLAELDSSYSLICCISLSLWSQKVKFTGYKRTAMIQEWPFYGPDHGVWSGHRQSRVKMNELSSFVLSENMPMHQSLTWILEYWHELNNHVHNTDKTQSMNLFLSLQGTSQTTGVSMEEEGFHEIVVDDVQLTCLTLVALIICSLWWREGCKQIL